MAHALDVDVDRGDRQADGLLDVKFHRVLDALGHHANARPIFHNDVYVDKYGPALKIYVDAPAAIAGDLG